MPLFHVGTVKPSCGHERQEHRGSVMPCAQPFCPAGTRKNWRLGLVNEDWTETKYERVGSLKGPEPWAWVWREERRYQERPS